jgi:hypothetical protein
MKRWSVIGGLMPLLLFVRLAHAGGLGIAGDGFLTSFITWLPTVGYAAMLVGIFAWLASSSDYGQGVLVLLTQWDDRWDDVLLASWRYRRYKKRYEAG